MAFASIIQTQVASAALLCNITATGSCGYTEVLHMSNLTNAHAELPSESNYNYSVCCYDDSAVNTIGTDSSGSNFLDLYSSTNAHVELTNQSNYFTNAYISASFDGINCIYNRNYGTCDSNYTCLATVSSNISGEDTNLHIADCITDPYQTSVCCKFIPAVTLYIYNPKNGDAYTYSTNILLNYTTSADSCIYEINGVINTTTECGSISKWIDFDFDGNYTLKFFAKNTESGDFRNETVVFSVNRDMSTGKMLIIGGILFSIFIFSMTLIYLSTSLGTEHIPMQLFTMGLSFFTTIFAVRGGLMVTREYLKTPFVVNNFVDIYNVLFWVLFSVFSLAVVYILYQGYSLMGQKHYEEI